MRRLIPILLILVSGSPAWAASPLAESLDARAVAMGGALRALARPAEAARANPAAIGRERGFFGAGSYLTRKAGAFDAAVITVVDNITSPFGGALQYLRLQGEEEREDLSLGIAWGRRGQWWGGTLRYVHGRVRGEAEWHDVVTGDLGVLFERPGGWRIAVVGTNLAETSLDFLQKRLALGVAKTRWRGWNLEADLVRNWDRDISRGLDAHLGAETQRPGSPWVLRLGQMWRGDTGKDYASVGIGWERGLVRAGYALQKARQRAGEYLHVFSLEGRF